ncbi:MAG: glycosyltransferase family 4 protein [Candidatus Bathyarchaeia archaeon]
MGRMRTLVAASGLGHIKRGVETWAQELAYALRNNVSVILCKGGGTRESNIEYVLPCIKRNSVILGGKFSPIPWGARVRIEESTFSFSLATIVRALNPDVVHVSQFFHSLFDLKKRKLIKSKIVFANGVGIPIHSLARMDYLYVQQLAPYYIEEAREQGINVQKWFTIPPFVNTQKFSPRIRTCLRETLGIPRDAFVALCVSAIKRKQKRVDWLIREVGKLKNDFRKEAFLVVVGETENETSSIVSQGRELLKNHIIFLSSLPDEAMPEVYALADLFVLASCSEPFGLVFLEAMASGKPVIGHSFPVTEWIIGDAGETVDMTREGQLAKAIERYIMDEDLREEKGRKGRERVEKMFSLDQIVKQTISMYNHITAVEN